MLRSPRRPAIPVRTTGGRARARPGSVRPDPGDSERVRGPRRRPTPGNRPGRKRGSSASGALAAGLVLVGGRREPRAVMATRRTLSGAQNRDRTSRAKPRAAIAVAARAPRRSVARAPDAVRARVAAATGRTAPRPATADQRKRPPIGARAPIGGRSTPRPGSVPAPALARGRNASAPAHPPCAARGSPLGRESRSRRW